MSTDDGVEPVADDEVLYRRVPVSMQWYVPDATPQLSPEAFAPRQDESEGISLYRAKYKTLAEVAAGKSKKGYYVAKMLASEIRARGITIRSDDPNDPGHVAVPELNALNHDTNEAQEIKLGLAECAGNMVEGPFLPTPHPNPG
jgi:hypothetical protein